jgi:hypothetical protein
VEADLAYWYTHALHIRTGSTSPRTPGCATGPTWCGEASRRALTAAAVAVLVSLVGLIVLRADAHRLCSHLLREGLPFGIGSGR